MILIADSGSTKTDWVSIGKDKTVVRQQTFGINPFYQSSKDIYENVKDLKHFQQVNHIYFYGAGCANQEKIEIVKKAMVKVFPDAEIDVNSDLLAVARSLCTNEEGIACILGTGSNSCYYDGENIVKNVSPLGYILGDEGGGAVLGKLFIADLLKNQLNESITKLFFNRYNTSASEILDNVYKKQFPNRYLAQYTKFMAENMNDSSIKRIISCNIGEFFERNVAQYSKCKELPIHFTGSIAYYFKEILETVAKEKGFIMGKILKSPVEGLISYHTKMNK